jgi:hypothetical protein
LRPIGRRRLTDFRLTEALRRRRRTTRFVATALAALFRRRRARRFAGAFFTARRDVLRFAALLRRRRTVRFLPFVADLRDAFLLAAILISLACPT